MKQIDAVRILNHSRHAHPLILLLRSPAAGFVLLIAGAFLIIMPGILFPSQSQKQQTKKEYALEIFEQWRAAVAQHEPGQLDNAAIKAFSWPESSMQSVLDMAHDVSKLLAEMRSGGTPRMDLSSPPCVALLMLDLTEKEWQRGDASRIAKQGAMLHADIALLAKEPVLPYTENALGRETLLVRDGIIYGSSKMAHWSYARRILDSLHPNSSQDDTVRRWYIATNSIMQKLLLWGPAKIHLQRAQEIFPQDADIQFLLGTLHECFASHRAQNAILPPDHTSDFASEETELRIAKQHFQQAQKIDSRFTKAHLHLGRVTGLLGSYKEAVAELMQAEETIADPQILYYLSLFLGSGLEMTGDFDGARKQYERAARLYPAAQSPWLVLSQLAWRKGDLREAIAAMEKAFTLQEVNDPWWEYLIAHVQDADSLLTEIRIEIGKLPR